MKAVITIGPGKSVVKEIEEPKMHDHAVKIKLKYQGVCHSEHYGWKHNENGGAFGHEPMGVIAEVGKHVTGYQIGDRISGFWGSSLPGTGGMVEYAVVDVDKSTVIKIPANIRSEDLVIEPLACMVSAVSKVRCTMPGTKVCVVGCGYMGCGAISLLKLRGFYVVAVDIRATSRQDALTYGADEACSPEEAIEKFIKSSPLLNELQRGFPVVMEWAETNESLDLAINLTKVCGQLCIGAYHTGPKRLVDMQQLNIKAIDMLSTHPRESDLNKESAFRALEMLSRGEWKYTGVPTMVYPITQFDRAQEEMETKYGHHMKALIDMELMDGDPYMISNRRIER